MYLRQTSIKGCCYCCCCHDDDDDNNTCKIILPSNNVCCFFGLWPMPSFRSSSCYYNNNKLFNLKCLFLLFLFFFSSDFQLLVTSKHAVVVFNTVKFKRKRGGVRGGGKGWGNPEKISSPPNLVSKWSAKCLTFTHLYWFMQINVRAHLQILQYITSHLHLLGGHKQVIEK